MDSKPIITYGERIALFQKDFESAFLSVFDLDDDYTRESLSPGDRYGFIDWYSQEADFSKGLGRNENLLGQFVLTFGTRNKKECDEICAIERNNIVNNLSKIREIVDNYGIVYHLEISDARVSSKSQSVVPPHFWICDIASTVKAMLYLPKDIAGKEIYYDNANNP